jgi:asparagine synthase (glutamine-hydrolysing)
MCGIAGFSDRSGRSSEDILAKMCDQLVHRGPDGNGNFFFEDQNIQTGLSHRRLSIIDLSDLGAQPMKRGNLVITFNGEIYNYREIRSALEKLGHSFSSQSDTEVILCAYRQWGVDCLKHFTGMFAFAIFNTDNGELFCARDRAGVKPFYYYWHNRLFLFASELKSFHKHPAFIKEIDPAALAAYMQFGNVPGQHCIFKYCSKISPGHYLLLKKNSEPELHRYWNVYDSYNQPKLDISFNEALEHTEKVIAEAAEYRMVSDVPVGIFLSGGYDSTCLTALLQKNRSEKLKTYTIGVPDIGLDEAPYAKTIAARLGTEHYEYYCTEKDALETVPLLPHFYDEPFADQSAIPTTLVSRIARKDVKVALSADGGDEIFAGYNRYAYLMKQGKLLRQSPAFLRHAALMIMNGISPDRIPYFRKQYNFHYRYEKYKLLLRDPSPKNLMFRLSKQFGDDELASMFAQKPAELDTAYLSDELKSEFFSPLAYMMAIDYQTYLPDDILQKVDRASMSQSLEAREPFLDHHLIEWAARLPDDFKYRKHIKKYILREIVHKYVPKELMDRPKMGFAIPIGSWLANELKEQVRYYLDENRVKQQGLLNHRFTAKIVSQFFSGKKELTTKLWYLLMHQMWYEKWMTRS